MFAIAVTGLPVDWTPMTGDDYYVAVDVQKKSEIYKKLKKELKVANNKVKIVKVRI